MALNDIPTGTPSAANASYDIRRILGAATRVAEAHLRQVRQLVAQFGRQAIAAELGADAGDLLTVYNSLKAAVETAQGTTIEELP